MKSRAFVTAFCAVLFYLFFNVQSFGQSLIFKNEISGYEKGLLQFAGWKNLNSNSNGLLAASDSEYHYIYILNQEQQLIQRFRPRLDYQTQLISEFDIDNANRIIVSLFDREGFSIYNSTGGLARTVSSGAHYCIETDEEGNIYTFGGSGLSIYDTNANFKKSFSAPGEFDTTPSIKVTQGKIFICDKSKVKVYSTDGDFLFGFNHLGSTNTTGKIAVHENGNIYIASYWNEIGIYSAAGVLIKKFTPFTPEGETPPIADIEFNSEGKLFLSRTSSTIQVFGEDESYISKFGTDYTKSNDVLHFPTSLSFDTKGNLRVLNGTTQSITTLDNDGNWISRINTVQSYQTVNTYMPSLTIDKNDRVIFFGYDKTDQNKVRILGSSGEVVKEILQPNSPFSFSHWACVSNDSKNNIYVYDLDYIYIYNGAGDYLRSYRSPYQDALPELDQYPFFLSTSSLFIDGSDNVFLIKPNTEYVVMTDTLGGSKKYFHAPYAIAVTADAERGVVYIATKAGLTMFDYEGNYLHSVSDFQLPIQVSLIADMAINPLTHHLVISDFFHQRLLNFQFLESQEITFDALPYGDFISDTFTLEATASSGLPVSFVSADPTIASIENNVVTLHGVGSTEITAVQEGNEFFEAAAPVVQTLTVDLIMASAPDPRLFVSAYPNPTNGTFSIPQLKPGDDVQIVNMVGGTAKLAFSELNRADITSYASGVYVIRITRGERSTTLKVVKR